MKQMNMTVKFHPMYAAANMLGYGLPFMNEICKRAYISGRPFLVAKNEDGKYFVEAKRLPYSRKRSAISRCSRGKSLT